MFTVEQIQAAHSKVKTGVDFPAYVQDIIQLGVTFYETYVSDGHTDYFGKDNYRVSSNAKYDTLVIADKNNSDQFKSELKEHQQGKTNYLSFCNSCATLGVEKWAVCMTKMTCTYYDKAGNEMLVEVVPTP
jgi:uncharacterized protein YbcV (DUF1398 family)